MNKKRKDLQGVQTYSHLALEKENPDFGRSIIQSDRILSLLCIKVPIFFAGHRLEIKTQLHLMPDLLKNHVLFELESEHISQYQIEELIKTILNTNFIH